MPQQAPQLDDVFHALSDATRRAVLHRLSRGTAPVSELAEPFDMALPSFMQHLRVLEASGLVRSSKIGRVRTYRLQPRRLEVAEAWMASQRREWEQRLDRLERYVEELKRREARSDQKNRT